MKRETSLCCLPTQLFADFFTARHVKGAKKTCSWRLCAWKIGIQSTLMGVVLLFSGTQINAQTTPSKYFVQDDTRLWTANGRAEMLRAIDGSLRFLRTRRAAAMYQRFERRGISRSRAERSLRRFRQLLQSSRTAAPLEAALQREFTRVRLAPTTHFTGYFEPIYNASRTRTNVYRYPLFRAPNLARWPRPHPTRLQLEGASGLQISPLLHGREIVWLRDRMEAYLVHVQGSARVRLTDGRTLNLGYAAHTNWPYTSMGRELVKAGVMPFEELTLPAMTEYFRRTPQEMNRYLPRNRRYIFFRERRGTALSGSLGVPLIAERSVALDATQLPPAALALAHVNFHNPAAARVFRAPRLTRLVFGHDAGSAIKGTARIDLFMGGGQQAGTRAGIINSMGQLDFLLLKK
jgi:membrane-bound lytic murein transglycosylase A